MTGLVERTKRPRLLIIEDDRLIRDGSATTLTAEGYDVRVRADGLDLDDQLLEYRPDLVVLDVALPSGPDGFQLAARIRAVSSISIVFITAADSLADRLRGFEAGADDYLVKPFSIQELAVRIRAVLRRTGTATLALMQVRDVRIDLYRRIAVRAGVELALTPTEFDLLATLATTPGQAWTKQQLVEEIWRVAHHAPHLVEVQMSGLRRKLEQHGPRLILTRRDGSYEIPA